MGIQAWESVRLNGGTVTIRRGGVDTEYDLAEHGGDPFAFMQAAPQPLSRTGVGRDAALRGRRGGLLRL